MYNEIPAAKRQRRHLRAAEVLEELYPEQRSELAGELASHYDLGNAPSQAIPHYLEAARQRLAVFADQEALTALNRALQLAGENTAQRTVFDLLLLSENLHYRRGERDEQHAVLQRLERLAADLSDLDLACEISKRQMLYYRAVDDHAAQKAQIDRLQRQAARLGSSHWQAEAMFAEGNYRKLTKNFAEAIERLEQALVLYREARETEGQVQCCCQLAELFIIERQSAEAEAWTQKALSLSKKSLPTYELMYTLWNLSANGLIAKDLERCLRYAGQLLEAAEQAHDLLWQAAASRLIGMAYQHQFRIPEARQRLNTALDLYQLIQKPKGCALTLQTLGHVEVSLGNYAAAIDNYQQGFQIGERLKDFYEMAGASINLSCAASFQEDYLAEKEYAQRGVSLARQAKNQHFEGAALQNLGEAERELGDLDLARQHLNEALSLMEDATQVIERASVQIDLALTHWKAGDLPLALQMVEQVLSVYPEIEGKDDNIHRFLWAAVQILRAAGQPERAAQILAQAHQAFQKDLAAIPDAEMRQTFAGMKHNRQIAAAYERGEWP